MQNIGDILKEICEGLSNVSDIYIGSEEYVSIRHLWVVKTRIKFQGKEEDLKTSYEDVKFYVNEQIRRYNINLDTLRDKKSYDVRVKSWDVNFRLNISVKDEKFLLIFRKINPEIIPLEQLGIDLKYLQGVLWRKNWLFLVSGPTGSWKSTTLSSIVNNFNQNENSHIITLENPIEQRYKNEKSVVHQFELWSDFFSFETAVENIVRQDPDIIVVWEIRSKETLDSAMRLAETWHLVLWTIHWKWSSWVIGKIIRMFENQNYACGQLADVLIWVLYQQKFNLDSGETAICLETLYNDTNVRAAFAQWHIKDFKSNMQTWAASWMITMEQYLDNYMKPKYDLNENEYRRVKSSIIWL